MRLLLLSALLATAATAQPSNWDLPTSGTTVGLSLDAAFFGDGLPFETSAVGFLTTTQPVGPGLRIVGDLPLAYTSGDGLGGDFTTYGVGNLQVGVEADLPVLPLAFGGYVRLPTATSGGGTEDGAQVVGAFAEYERFGAFLNDVVTVSALAEARVPVGAPGLSLRLRAIPQVLIATGDGDPVSFGIEETEALAGYAAHLLFDPPLSPVRLGAGVSGITILTEDTGDASTTQFFAGVTADAAFGSLRPGVQARLPLGGDLDDALDAIVGVRLGIAFD